MAISTLPKWTGLTSCCPLSNTGSALHSAWTCVTPSAVASARSSHTRPSQALPSILGVRFSASSCSSSPSSYSGSLVDCTCSQLEQSDSCSTSQLQLGLHSMPPFGDMGYSSPPYRDGSFYII